MHEKLVDDFCARLEALFAQTPLPAAQAELKNNIRAIAQATLSRLDVVSREEFEVQSQILAATAAKLEALEKKVRNNG